MQLDKLDLGILECLALNCRLAHTTIAEALRVSPNTVATRIKLLEQAQVIRQYVTLVDLRPLGFQRHHLLLRFLGKGHNVHTLCRALSRSPSAVWIVSYTGTYDAQVIFDTHEELSMDAVLREISSHCADALQDYAVFSDYEDIEFTNFLPIFGQQPPLAIRDDGSFSTLLLKRSFPAKAEVKRYEYSQMELKLLLALGKDPRISITDLATLIGAERQTIRRRIERLIEAGVILNFGVGFDHQQLGFSAYHALFRLHPGTSTAARSKAFRGIEGVFYAGSVHGAYDLSAYFYTRTPQDLNRHMQLVRASFGAQVLRTDLLVYDLVHHWRQCTQAVCAVMEQTLRVR